MDQKDWIIMGLALALLTSASMTIDTLGTRRTFSGFNGWYSFGVVVAASSYFALKIWDEVKPSWF